MTILKFIRKNFKKSIILILLCLILGYVTNITSIPERIVIFENEKLNLGQIFGITIKEKGDSVIQTSNIDNKFI